MINLSLFGFFTGLHLALLQFSYFFVLLINITSTYITYATVVISWMAGTLIGLLWRRVTARLSLCVGVVGYYLIYALVISDPLAPHVLPFAAVGIAASGLWAGRFFVDMRPLFARADRLFFHENNGFLLGIVTVFIGFTLLGQTFLLWVPALSGAALLSHMRFLPASSPFDDSEDANSRILSSHAAVVLLSDTADRLLLRFARFLVAVNVGLPLVLIVYAEITGENYMDMFLGERNAITWFSSVQLLIVALVAYVNHEVAALVRRLRVADVGKHYWIWLIFALGFVFLALDEQFEFHEALRDDFLVPADIFVGIPFIREGDIGLLLYLAVGLVFAGFLFNELRRQRLAVILFGAAMALTLATVVVDTLPMEIMREWPMNRFWSSVFEEVGELWAQLLFLLSFTVILRSRLNQLGIAPEGGAREQVAIT